MGKYAALTSVGTFLVLNPQKAHLASASPGDTEGSNPSTETL